MSDTHVAVSLPAHMPWSVKDIEIHNRCRLSLTLPLFPPFAFSFATWCGPCLMLAKELEAVAEALGDKVKVLKVDVDENPELSTQLRVSDLDSCLS